MPGPPPKNPQTRAGHRAKAATRATLTAIDPADVKVPDLPTDLAFSWHRLTRKWWREVWASPMSSEWHESDIHGLYRLAVLVNDYWLAESVTARLKIAPEIRQSAQPFGLSPLDRRRLEWSIEQSEDAKSKGRKREAREAAPPSAPSRADGRLHLLG